MDDAPAVKKPGIMEQQDQKVCLSTLETQCILQLMQNKTLVNIGVELGLRQNTVRFYLLNAGQKLRSIAKK